MSNVDSKWADRIRSGDRRVLVSQFRHEAAELRRIASEQPSSFHPPWRDFRCFLADVGPSPGPAYRLQRQNRTATYRPGEVVWRLSGETSGEGGETTRSDWTMITGMPQGTGVALELPRHLAFAAAMNPAERIDAGAALAAVDIGDLSWFSPSANHQQAFRLAYLAWSAHVQPKYRSAATPQFLYLFTLIPAMARAKATLEAEGLWKPLTKTAQEQRDDHPAWKRFNELLPKATMIAAGFEIYRQYSMTEDIDELNARIGAAELRFRTGGKDVRAA
jgi:hypothetical protein